MKLDPISDPAHVWAYILDLRRIVADVIEGNYSFSGPPERDLARTHDGAFENLTIQWDAYTNIRFWVDERIVPSIFDNDDLAVRYQVATAYLHPTGEGSTTFECGENLDDRCRIELFRERI